MPLSAGTNPTGQPCAGHGGGGVEAFAVQVARAKGAGADLGVVEAIDYTTTRFEDVARDVDVVFDTVAGDLTARSFAVLKLGGIYVTPSGQPDAAAAAARGVRASGMLRSRMRPTSPPSPA